MATKDYFDNHIVDADDFDQRDLEIVEDQSPVIANLKKRGHEMVNNNFPNLVDDLFQSFYQYQPQIRKRVPGNLARNQLFLEELVASPDYAELRVSTKNDDFSSALAAINLTENLLEKLAKNEDLREQFKQQPPLPPEKREEKKDEEEEQEDGEGQSSDQGEGQNPGEGGEGSSEGSGEGQSGGQPQNQGQGQSHDQTKEQIKDQQDSSAELSEQQHAQREAQARALRNIIREAAEKTADDLRSVEVFATAYGTSEDELKKMTFEERRKFIERIRQNKHLVELAERVGRFQRMLKKAKMERSVHARQEIVGVTQSNDIQHQLPREHAMRKKVPLDWKRRFVQRKLQTYKMEGNVPMGKGPVVICIDKSSSMYGQRDQWATAVMFAVMAEASRDKRTIHVCFYNAGLQHTQTLIGGQYGISDLIGLTEYAPSGGTNFDKPLVYSYERIKSDPELRQADIVFITDGGCKISEDVKKKLEEQRGKQDICLFTILIGMFGQEDNEWIQDLKSISDETHCLESMLQESEKTMAMFASMANHTRL